MLAHLNKISGVASVFLMLSIFEQGRFIVIQTLPKRFWNMPSKSAFQKNSWHTVNEILENWAKNGSGSVEIKTWIATVRNGIVSIETNLTKHEEIVQTLTFASLPTRFA